MAQKLPKWLTQRQGAHRFLSWLAAMQIKWQAYKDLNAARRAQRKNTKRPH